jgi:hypothetical protein
MSQDADVDDLGDELESPAPASLRTLGGGASTVLGFLKELTFVVGRATIPEVPAILVAFWLVGPGKATLGLQLEAATALALAIVAVPFFDALRS